jgi:hypothetical protein
VPRRPKKLFASAGAAVAIKASEMLAGEIRKVA